MKGSKASKGSSSQARSTKSGVKGSSRTQPRQSGGKFAQGTR